MSFRKEHSSLENYVDSLWDIFERIKKLSYQEEPSLKRNMVEIKKHKQYVSIQEDELLERLKSINESHIEVRIGKSICILRSTLFQRVEIYLLPPVSIKNWKAVENKDWLESVRDPISQLLNDDVIDIARLPNSYIGKKIWLYVWLKIQKQKEIGSEKASSEYALGGTLEQQDFYVPLFEAMKESSIILHLKDNWWSKLQFVRACDKELRTQLGKSKLIDLFVKNSRSKTAAI